MQISTNAFKCVYCLFSNFPFQCRFVNRHSNDYSIITSNIGVIYESIQYLYIRRACRWICIFFFIIAFIHFWIVVKRFASASFGRRLPLPSALKKTWIVFFIQRIPFLLLCIYVFAAGFRSTPSFCPRIGQQVIVHFNFAFSLLSPRALQSFRHWLRSEFPLW